jgi:hypothetical protein
MTAQAATTVYEAAPSKADNNIAFGLSPEECAVRIDAGEGFDFAWLYQHGDESNTGHSLVSTGEGIATTSSMPLSSSFNWYCKPTYVGRTVGTIVDSWYDTAPRIVVLGLTCSIDAGGAVTAPALTPLELPSTQTQRQERDATARLANAVAALLPEFSEGDLAGLVGVSRLTWRGWSRGARVARRAKRQRLLRLQRILELRHRVDPETSLGLWLDTPVGTDVDVTPARLLANGRDRLVSILAARAPSPEGGGLVLDRPLDLGGLVSVEEVDADLAVGRELYSADSDEGGDD